MVIYLKLLYSFVAEKNGKSIELRLGEVCSSSGVVVCALDEIDSLINSGMRDDLGLFQSIKISSQDGNLKRLFNINTRPAGYIFFDEMAVYYFSNQGGRVLLKHFIDQEGGSAKHLLSWKLKSFANVEE